VSTKAVDVAGVLYQAIAPQPVPEGWPQEACWDYHGVPQHLVFTEDGRLPGVPVCPPETLVVDRGKAFELPRVFRTGILRLIHAAACPFRNSSMTSCGVRYPSPEWRRVLL